MEPTRSQDEGEREPKRPRLDLVSQSRLVGSPRHISPKSRPTDIRSIPVSKPPNKSSMSIQQRPSYGVLTEEEEAKRQQWRSEMGRVPSSSQTEQLNLDLDPNYQNWTTEEKDADRQRWRHESGRISGVPRKKPLNLELDPDYQNWTREEKEADQHRWRLENGRISALAVQKSRDQEKPMERLSDTRNVAKEQLGILCKNEHEKTNSSLPMIWKEDEDPNPKLDINVMRQKRQRQKNIKNETKEENLRIKQEAKREDLLERCNKWMDDIEARRRRHSNKKSSIRDTTMDNRN